VKLVNRFHLGLLPMLVLEVKWVGFNVPCSGWEPLGISGTEFLRAGWPSCNPTNAIKALNEAQSTDPNQRKPCTGFILSSSTNRLPSEEALLFDTIISTTNLFNNHYKYNQYQTHRTTINQPHRHYQIKGISRTEHSQKIQWNDAKEITNSFDVLIGLKNMQSSRVSGKEGSRGQVHLKKLPLHCRKPIN